MNCARTTSAHGPVGKTVGNIVDASVGGTVGEYDGWSVLKRDAVVGSADGTIVGTTDGDKDGANVGILLGVSVGAGVPRVGAAVGVIEGRIDEKSAAVVGDSVTVVGDNVGVAVGTALGGKDGEADGVPDGMSDGTSVGGCDVPSVPVRGTGVDATVGGIDGTCRPSHAINSS